MPSKPRDWFAINGWIVSKDGSVRAREALGDAERNEGALHRLMTRRGPLLDAALTK